MATFHPYLNFAGNTEEAFNFYKSVFGGDFITLMRFKDIPGGSELPPGTEDMLMHISLAIGGGTILMATDAIESMGQHLIEGNNTSIYIKAERKDEADTLYNALSAGGKIEMELADQFWGDYYAAFADKFGIQWMVSYEYPKA